jgi:PKHD-type hydroxylase
MLRGSSRSRGGEPLRFWRVIPEAFSPEECAQITDIFNSHEGADGGLVTGLLDQGVRQSSLVWLPESVDLAWVSARIVRLTADANHDLFHFTLDGFDEQLQLAAYGPGHYYDWHIDRGQGETAGRRKLTLAVQLTDPNQYVGGGLEINADGHPFQSPRDQGTAVVFAATTLHRVVPMISGLRHSLVAWTHGPAFV